MRRRIVIASIALLWLPREVAAQQRTGGDTTLKGTTIEVIQSYKPEVKQLPKPQFTAELPPRDTSRPQFRYEVPQQTLNYTYSALPLRPLALGKDTTKLPFPGYLKVGAGNFSTIFLDAGIGNLKGENYETAIHLHHLSQEGNIKNQKTSLSGIEAEGTLHTGTNAWRLSLEGLRNQYHYFGYDHRVYDYSRDTVQQTFTGVSVGLDVKNEGTNAWGLRYHPMVRGSIYGDSHEASERTVEFNVPVAKDIDEYLSAGIGVGGAITSLTLPSGNKSNNIVQITPHVAFKRGAFEGRAGLYPTFSQYYSTQLLPNVVASYKIPNSDFVVTLGWESRIIQNTYKELTSINPYLTPVEYAPAMYSNLHRQSKTDEGYGKVSTNLGNQFTISAKVSWRHYSNLPMFLNDSADSKNFYILYDQSVHATSVEASIRYNVANTLSAGITGSFFNFYNTTFSRVYHVPGIRFRGDLSWTPIKNLTITGYATILDKMYALNQAHVETKLDGVFDLGAGAEYVFIPRLSAFINTNNLLNDRYQRWYRYESYGFNVYGGLRLKF